MGSSVNSNEGSEQKIELSKQEIEQIFLENVSKIQENYPLVNIIRLFKGNINFNISFDNLKYVNTNFSKPEADVAINIIKEIFDEFIFELNEENKITRTIKNTYKSKLYGFKKELLAKFIINLQKICKENCEENCEELKERKNKSLEEQLTQFEEFLPDIITEEKFLSKLKEKQDNLEKKGFNIDKIKEIFGHLKVNLSVKENKAESFEDKMLHIYEIEFDSIINSSIFKDALKDDTDLLENLKDKNSTLLKKAQLVAEKILEIEKEIEKIKPELSYSTNPELFFKTLETVKKGHSTGNKELDKLFENYKAIISAFDIISPITKEVDYAQLEKKAKEQNESIKDYRTLTDIKTGKKTEDELIKDDKNNFNFLSQTKEKYNETIKSFLKKNKKISFKNKKEDTEEGKKNKILHKKLNIYNEIQELTKKTYKGFSTRNKLAEEISGKKGTLMFIDIAGMGISNIKENRQIIEDILNDELSEKEKRLLEAGLPMTKKVIEIAEKLKDLGAKVSLGGDEFFIFIPENSEEKLNKYTIAKIFQEKEVKARTTYLKIDKPIKIDEENDASLFEENDSDEKKLIKKIFSIFDKLDHISEINKNIENSGKFFIPGKKEKEDFHFSFEIQKNYEKKVKKILKENKKLFSKNDNSENKKNKETKENKIINFFEVSLDDLIGEKEQIIRNFKGKISYILDENYFDVIKKNYFWQKLVLLWSKNLAKKLNINFLKIRKFLKKFN